MSLRITNSPSHRIVSPRKVVRHLLNIFGLSLVAGGVAAFIPETFASILLLCALSIHTFLMGRTFYLIRERRASHIHWLDLVAIGGLFCVGPVIVSRNMRMPPKG
jgi:hypothetical protein